MNTVINIYAKKAKTDLVVFKEKGYQVEVRFDNVHLRDINKLLNFNLFSKNDLFVESQTLYELMQPIGGRGKHHYHGLTPEDVLESLRNVDNPYCVLENENNRVAIISSIISHFGEPLMIIIELNDGLKDDTSAKINKMVTMFPKSNVDEYIDKIGSKKVYYLNKGNVVKEKAQFRALGNEYQYRHTGLNCILYRSKMYLFMGPVFSSPLFPGASNARGLVIDFVG